MGKKKKEIIFIVSAVLIVLFLIVLIPMGKFTHGYFYTEPEFDETVQSILLNPLTDKIEQEFQPIKNDNVGVEFRISGYKSGMDGFIIASVKDEQGKEICSEKLDVAKITKDGWRQVYFNKYLKKNHHYTFVLTGEKGTTALPDVVLVREGSLQNQDENTNTVIAEDDGQYVLLAAYAYAKQTFTDYEKIMILMFAVSLILLLGYWYEGKKKLKNTALFIILVTVLTWNYTDNAMDVSNSDFADFQADSETLVSNVVFATLNGVRMDSYGLGRVVNIGGIFTYDLIDNPDTPFPTNDSFDRGYSLKTPSIAVPVNKYTKEVLKTGNKIQFANGEIYTVTAIEAGEYYYVTLDAKAPLTHVLNGSLMDIRMLDASGNYLPAEKWDHYKSQYGLQGKVMRRLTAYFGTEDSYYIFEFLCSLSTAIVFTIIVYLLSAKYNKLFAGVFYITFWLSPWIVNFARNLYWVEFTWFLPMIVGLLVSMHLENRKVRIAGYFAAAIAIFIKCLCGYEYTTTIMMGLIAFLLTDFITAIIQKDKSKKLLLIKTIMIIGMAALAGFALAIVIHGEIRGGGNLLAGIKDIWNQDVMRRTSGGHLEDFAPEYWPSLNASKWEVICTYFKFSTEIIAGIPGNLFPLMALLPLCIFGWDYCHCRKLDYRMPALYIVMFLTSISWFYFGKSHSYIHVRLNYVMWYFGYVQVCLYIIANRVIKWGSSRGMSNESK